MAHSDQLWPTWPNNWWYFYFSVKCWYGNFRNVYTDRYGHISYCSYSTRSGERSALVFVYCHLTMCLTETVVFRSVIDIYINIWLHIKYSSCSLTYHTEFWGCLDGMAFHWIAYNPICLLASYIVDVIQHDCLLAHIVHFDGFLARVAAHLHTIIVCLVLYLLFCNRGGTKLR